MDIWSQEYLESELLDWFCQFRINSTHLWGSILNERGDEIVSKLAISFKCYVWLHFYKDVDCVTACT